MIEALKRLWQAIQRLGTGPESGSPAVSGDLMQQVGAMQTYWRVFLQELLRDGLSEAPSGYGADSTAMTDVEQFMRPDVGSVPDATLADLGEWMDGPESDAPDALPAVGSGQESGGDTSWLDEYLKAPEDDDSLDDLDLPDGA